MKQILLFVLTVTSLTSFSQTGTPDGLFGTDGKVITSVTDFDDYAGATLVQPDGKIVVAGSSGTYPEFDFTVVRYNADGSLDPTFNGTGKVITDIGTDDTPLAIARQQDGKILVAGYTSDESTGAYDFALVRYKTDGSLNTDFNGTGKVITDMGGDDDGANAIIIQPDGKIVLAGSAGNVDEPYDFALVRYKTDGSLDTDFNGTGKVITDFEGNDDAIASIVLQPDGKIVASGGSGNEDEGYDFAVVRYNSNGSLDGNFNGTGKVVTDLGGGDEASLAVALQPDGKIVAAGLTSSNGANDFALVRYKTDGSLDTDFNGTGKVITDVAGGVDEQAWNVNIQADGKILVGGYGDNASTGEYDFELVRYKPDGSLDPTFNGTGKVTVDFGGNDYGYRTVLYGTRIYMVGYTDVNGSFDFAVTALLSDVAAPLPLSLTSFAATKKTNSVQLSWTTVNEQNISSFEIIRSGDGRSFNGIGSVKAVGNSSAKENYTFTDAQPLAGTNHYRLKIVEAGGKTSYSSIVAVKMNPFAKLEIFPNPVHNSLNVQFNATTANPLQIRDATGRLVKTVSVNQTGNVAIPVDVSSLQKGIYYLQAEGETVQFMKE